jgi:transposase
MPHHGARFSARGRELVVRRVIEDGETFAQAAAWANVSKSTVWAWVGRWRQAGPRERDELTCLQDRSSRPHSSPTQVPAEEAERICALRRRTGWSPRRLADEPDVARPHSTVHHILRRGGCSRPPASERPPVIRYEWPCPGQLLHMDQALRALPGARARRHR